MLHADRLGAGRSAGVQDEKPRLCGKQRALSGAYSFAARKNVMFAFTNAAGHRESDRISSADLKKITIGQLSGALSNEKLIGQIFDGPKYKVTYKPNMEDSLL